MAYNQDNRYFNDTKITFMKVKKKLTLPKLFSRTKSGQLRSFRIAVRYYKKNLVVMTTKKKVEPNGKLTYDTYKYTEGKNIGRANETSAWEQAKREANSMFLRLKDKGYEDHIPEEKSTPEPMLAIKWDEKRIKFPCMVQAKLDGVRCIMYKDQDGVHLKSRRGKELEIPHIKKFFEEHIEVLPLDGELYNHGDLSFQGIISAVKRLSKKTDKINIVVYDKPVEGVPNYDRQFKLIKKDKKRVGKNAPIKFLDTIIANNLEEIYQYHDKMVKQGYEGVIIRNFDGLYEMGYRSHNLIKLKRFWDEEFPIVDVIEATGRDKGTGIFVLKAKNGELFKARPQGSKQLRTSYLRDRDSLIGKPCTVKYQELSDYGIPRFPSAIAVRDYEG